MPLKIIKLYGSLNGKIATIIRAKVQFDGSPSFCADASGQGDLGIPAERSDGECIEVSKAPFMWHVDEMIEPKFEIDIHSLRAKISN